MSSDNQFLQNCRRSPFFAIFTITMSIAVIGIVIGLSIPMVALRLHNYGVNELYIGIISAAPALGMFLIAPVVQRIVLWSGKRKYVIGNHHFCCEFIAITQYLTAVVIISFAARYWFG